MIGLLRDLVLGPGVAAYAVRKRIGKGSWPTDLHSRSGRLAEPLRRARGPRILVHGVSVGEIHALEPLVEALAASPVAPDVVVSASTATGFERARRIHTPDREVVRFPLDFTWMTARFLDAVRPDLVVLAELELWPSFLAACARRRTPVCVVNGRLSARSFRGYRRLRALARPMFRQLALVTAQTATYRNRFVAMGVPADRAVVGGSLKWDAARTAPDPAAAAALAAALGIDRSRPLIVAGSTGPGEEGALLRDLPDGCQLLLAPRDPDRWDAVARLVPGMPRRSRANASQSRANTSRSHAPPQVFLLDTIGDLPAAYLLADAVFVGRSLSLLGGSNPLEAAALGKPVVTGPHHENFAGVVDALMREGGIAVSTDPMASVRRWLADPQAAAAVVEGARRAMARHRGAARSTADRVLALLPGGEADAEG
ncbi:MAG: glycosyltransferase [Gemmatimonadota bacterium]|nr:glycosyltransferase [Gemmatimonadota bacterium]